MAVTITHITYREITAHAAEAFPNECCGFIVRRAGRQEVVPVSNVQDRLHALDPQQYPRTATTAYSMGKEQLPVIRGHEHGELAIEAVYHSHPQHDAYFSDEDRKNAAPGGEPTYPQAGQIVISVYGGEVKAVKAFGWDDQRRDFPEVELRVTDGAQR
jgi:proteasome lid subunit RPN8/RPN11